LTEHVSLAVLYIHPVGTFGGASRSLLELLRGFPPGAVRPRLIVPRGQAATLLEREGLAILRVRGITQFDCTRFGHYRGLRWLILLRELYFLPFTAWAVWRARQGWRDIDLIHVNEITALPAALLAKALFRKPLVIHVRSVQEDRGMPLRRDLVKRLLARYADAVIAIDQTVRASLPPTIEASIVRNGFTPAADAGIPAAVATFSKRFHDGSFRVGMIGNLLSLKGVFDFLEAARLCIGRHANVDFVVVGSNPRTLTGLKGAALKWLGFARDLEADMDRFIAEHGLQDRVHRLGFTPEVSAVYRSLDVVCFPSHLDAVGRPVLEAAWVGVPSIVAVDHPSPDTFVPGETGVQVPARDPAALATAIEQLSLRRHDVRRMGQAARRLAEANFDSRKNAHRVLEIYQRLTPKRDTRGERYGGREGE
jgi:glycosyltransferase involved in cell wall biosynthesis